MVTQLSYRVQAAGNQNGTRSHGEAFLAARGARNVDLGIRAVSGVGTIDVSALYGGVPIMRIDITAAGDAQRTDRLTFTIAPEAAVNLVSLRGFGTVRATEYDVCDLLISGSHDIRLAAVGLGIASADPPSLLDSVLEGSEFSRFEFATAFTSVPYVRNREVDAGNNGGCRQDASDWRSTRHTVLSEKACPGRLVHTPGGDALDEGAERGWRLRKRRVVAGAEILDRLAEVEPVAAVVLDAEIAQAIGSIADLDADRRARAAHLLVEAVGTGGPRAALRVRRERVAGQRPREEARQGVPRGDTVEDPCGVWPTEKENQLVSPSLPGVA